MKKILIILTMIFFIVLGGCNKSEDWWNNTDHKRAKNCRETIAKKGLVVSREGNYQTGNIVDKNRSGFTLVACDSIARTCRDEISLTLRGELIPELANLISVLSKEYRTQRDGFTSERAKAHRKDELWNKFGGGHENVIDPELFRVFRSYPNALAAIVYDYVIDTLLFSGGTRYHNGDQPVNDHEINILELFDSPITWGDYEDWWVLQSDEYYWYVYYFAVDPANYAEAKSAGLPTPTLEEMRELYPPEKLESFRTIEEAREWTKTQADYMQSDSKPVAIQENKIY